MTTIAIVNGKGGVAKTTTTQHLGHILAERGHNVLVADIDPQANLTKRLLGTADRAPTIADVLDDGALLYEAIVGTGCDRLSLLPSNWALDDTDSRMVIDPFGVMRLDNILRGALGNTHFVLIDCPPNLGSLTTAALIAADYVIVPVQPEASAIDGIERIQTKLADIRKALRRSPQIIGTIATIVEDVNLHRNGLGQLRRGWMPPLLGEIPKRKGVNAEGELREAYKPVADRLLALLSVEK